MSLKKYSHYLALLESIESFIEVLDEYFTIIPCYLLRMPTPKSILLLPVRNIT